MGVNSYAYLRVGIPIQRSDLYESVRNMRACPKHPLAEIGDAEIAFCPKCGTAIQRIDVEQPTAGCVRLAQKLGIEDPMDLWSCLCDSGELCSSARLASNMDRAEPDLLCVELTSVDDYFPGSGRVSKAALQDAEEKLRSWMDCLGVDGEPALYCQLYMSC